MHGDRPRATRLLRLEGPPQRQIELEYLGIGTLGLHLGRLPRRLADRPLVPGQDLIQESDHDYIDGSFTAGYALTEKTDLQAQYFVYYANNFTDNSASSVPYNVSAEEHGITGTLIHRFSSELRMNVHWQKETLRSSPAANVD